MRSEDDCNYTLGRVNRIFAGDQVSIKHELLASKNRPYGRYLLLGTGRFRDSDTWNYKKGSYGCSYGQGTFGGSLRLQKGKGLGFGHEALGFGLEGPRALG